MKQLLFIFLLSFVFLIPSQAQKHLYTKAENDRMLFLLDSTEKELIKITSSLTEAQFFYHVDTLTWSANDIVEHLGLIDEGYIRELWFSLAQPAFPASYTDSTKGGDEKAIAYATQPEKGTARGSNLPRNRYANKETCIRIFSEANVQAKEFFTVNAAKDLRRYFAFRIDSKGVRSTRDIYQVALFMVSHRIRHTNQLKSIIADPRFPK